MAKKENFKIPFDHLDNALSYDVNTVYHYVDMTNGKVMESGVDFNVSTDSSVLAYKDDETKRKYEDGTIQGKHLDTIWKDNFEFRDEMTLQGFERGRSAAHAIFKSNGGKRYQMFLKDLENVLISEGIFHGVIEGKWTFVKRGANYGVRFVTK